LSSQLHWSLASCVWPDGVPLSRSCRLWRRWVM
jgi:hypothetical protein